MDTNGDNSTAVEDIGLGDKASTIAAYIKRFRTQPPMRSQDRSLPKTTNSFWWKRDTDDIAGGDPRSVSQLSVEEELLELKAAGSSLDALLAKPRGLDSLTPSLDALMAELHVDQTQSLNVRADAILAKYGCMQSSVDSDAEANSVSSSSSLEGLALIEDAPSEMLDSKQYMVVVEDNLLINERPKSLSPKRVRSPKPGMVEVEVEIEVGVKEQSKGAKDVACQGEIPFDYSLVEEVEEAEDDDEASGLKEEATLDKEFLHVNNVCGEEEDASDIILEYLHGQVKQLEDEYKALQERERSILEQLQSSPLQAHPPLS